MFDCLTIPSQQYDPYTCDLKLSSINLTSGLQAYARCKTHSSTQTEEKNRYVHVTGVTPYSIPPFQACRGFWTNQKKRWVRWWKWLKILSQWTMIHFCNLITAKIKPPLLLLLLPHRVNTENDFWGHTRQAMRWISELEYREWVS